MEDTLKKIYALVDNMLLDPYRNESVLQIIKLLSEGFSGEISSNTYSLKKVDPTSEDYVASFQLLDHNGNPSGDTINLFKDQHLESVDYNEETKKLEFVFILQDGSEKPVEVPMEDLFQNYIQGTGILMEKQEDGSIKVSLDPEVLTPYLKKSEAEEKYQPKGNYAPAAPGNDPYAKRSEIPPAPDLSPYLTKASAKEIYQPKGNYLTQVPEEYIPVTEVDSKKVWALPEETQIMGTIAGALYALLSLRIYNKGQDDEITQTEVGTTSHHLNLNTSDNLTYDTPEGKKTVATTDEIPAVDAGAVRIPVRTIADKVYTKAEIMNWFGIDDGTSEDSVVELKRLFAYGPQLYIDWGISLSGRPMRYKMPIQYSAFESNNQIKLVVVGLDTSDDSVSKYTILINLDGTIIEGNSNVQVTLKTIETTE